MNTPIDFIKKDDTLNSIFNLNHDHCDDSFYTEVFDKDRLSCEEDVIVNHYNPFQNPDPISAIKPKSFVYDFYTTFISEYNSLLSTSKDPIDLDSDILFPGIRYMTPGIIVFERPPAHHVISVSHDYRDSLKDETPMSEYYIPIPWQVYVCEYNPSDMRLFSVRMFFSNSSLMSLDQTLYTPPMFNFYSNGNLCRPFFSSIEDIEKYPKNISGIIASAFDWVWNSGFNYDITDSISFFLGQTKGHLQFENFIPENLKPAYNSFCSQRYNGYSSNISKSTVNYFFKFWETVPLELISSFYWNPVSSSQTFWFTNLHDSTDAIISHYLSTNNLILVDADCDHSCHCEECCDENEDIADCRDYLESIDTTQNSVTYIWLRDNIDFPKYFAEFYIKNLNNNISSVINDSISMLKNTGIINQKPFYTTFHSFHNKISSFLG